MKYQGLMRAVVIALLTVGVFAEGQRFCGSASAQSRQKWEYQSAKLGHDRELNLLGDNGREAVGINDNWVRLKRGK
jgi:hypothetical protein